MKALVAGTDPYLGFLDFPGLGTSPAQQLFGCRTKTLLPTAGSLLHHANAVATAQLLQARKDRQPFYYDSGSKALPPLEKGNSVRIRPSSTASGGPKRLYRDQWVCAHIKFMYLQEAEWCIGGIIVISI